MLEFPDMTLRFPIKKRQVMEKAIINQIAPEFTLKDQNGTNHSLSDYRGEWILLFFYLKDGGFT